MNANCNISQGAPLSDDGVYLAHVLKHNFPSCNIRLISDEEDKNAVINKRLAELRGTLKKDNCRWIIIGNGVTLNN